MRLKLHAGTATEYEALGSSGINHGSSLPPIMLTDVSTYVSLVAGILERLTVISRRSGRYFWSLPRIEPMITAFGAALTF